MSENIRSFRELRVFQAAFEGAIELYDISKRFPAEEKYSLTDQIRRSSRSVCANIGEAWRKRRYAAAFVAKMSDAEAEACETQVWLMFAQRCGYINNALFERLTDTYDHVIAQLTKMIDSSDQWLLRPHRSAAPLPSPMRTLTPSPRRRVAPSPRQEI